MIRLAGILSILLAASASRADSFDDYNNLHLRAVSASPNAKKVERLGRLDLVEYKDVLPRTEGTMLIVHTNDNRWAKLLVHASGQKIDQERLVPTILIERFATYKEGEERATVAAGANVQLFQDFRFNLDIGAIVPDKGFPADLCVVADKDGIRLEPVGKAELFLVTEHWPDAKPQKSAKVVVGEKFVENHFNGVYKVFDDGRKSGELTLVVGPKGAVTGSFFSSTTGAKYEVVGQVGPNPKHGIQFSVTLPRTTQVFTGWMFTGNAQAITGYTTMEGREAGFYAVRVE